MIRLLGHECTRCSSTRKLSLDRKRGHGVGIDVRGGIPRFGRRRCFARQGGCPEIVAAAHAWLSSQPRSNTRQAVNCIAASAAFDCSRTCGAARHGLCPLRPSRSPQSSASARFGASRMHVGCDMHSCCRCRSALYALSPGPPTGHVTEILTGSPSLASISATPSWMSAVVRTVHGIDQCPALHRWTCPCTRSCRLLCTGCKMWRRQSTCRLGIGLTCACWTTASWTSWSAPWAATRSASRRTPPPQGPHCCSSSRMMAWRWC